MTREERKEWKEWKEFWEWFGKTKIWVERLKYLGVQG